ncbi:MULTISPECIES: hypothetical protein [Bacillus]|uniref:Uncharacterized protein n=1 Tax=Bacillus cereus TaxID=1396 RepID=A0A9X6GDG6_BACCE|nr:MULTISPECIES: hypothetical protein [Bacillus cereus group]MBG9522190.1 hypothetical protein [Bacillus thuringiensis]OOR72450.1 hypothetical protein BLX06_24790 [Bacillus cereus]
MVLEISGVDCVMYSDRIEKLVVDTSKDDVSIYHDGEFTYASNDTSGEMIVIEKGTLKIKIK